MAVTYDLVAVGDVMLDVHVPAPPLGGVVHDAIRVHAGGSAVNAARCARRLGARAAVVGGVGDDAAGSALHDALRRDGIDTFLETLPATTGTVAYIGTGVVADRGANAGFRPGVLPSARVTLVSGYLDEQAVREALVQANGLRALDLQRPGVPAFDAEVVLGPDLDLDSLAGRHQIVCSTLGARGAVAVRDRERVEVPVSRVLAESPRGAGDAFAAGFLLALVEGHELAVSLERGCRAALGA
jgi:ribokinase